MIGLRSHRLCQGDVRRIFGFFYKIVNFGVGRVLRDADLFVYREDSPRRHRVTEKKNQVSDVRRQDSGKRGPQRATEILLHKAVPIPSGLVASKYWG